MKPYLLLYALTLMGCASPGRDISAGLEAQAKRGPTTKAHILEIMGKPDRVTVDGGLESWEYTFAYDRETQLSHPARTIGTHGRVKSSQLVTFSGDMVGSVYGKFRDLTSRAALQAHEASQRLTFHNSHDSRCRK